MAPDSSPPADRSRHQPDNPHQAETPVSRCASQGDEGQHETRRTGDIDGEDIDPAQSAVPNGTPREQTPV